METAFLDTKIRAFCAELKPFKDSTPEPLSYATSGSSGVDLRAYIKDKIILFPFHRVLVPTGYMLEMREGLEAQVRSRSGLAAKHGIIVLNSPGTIDADYKGEICVILYNTDPVNEFVINPNDRIAQLVLAPIAHVACQFTNCVRGEGGFGHTGTE